MSSILTNNSAMVALSTLRNINMNLSETQSNISTGKKIANAKDNAAIWSVSAVMKSDVTGFKAINDSLALGAATLNVARNGAETVNKLMDELKGRIVAAQADNVDRAKIQADAASLSANISATVEASQFNGLNMLKGVNGETSVDVIGSLDRNSAGQVTVSNISVARSSLEGGTAGTAIVNNGIAATAATAVNTFGAAATDLTRSLYSVGDVVALKLTTATGQGVMFSYEIQASDVEVADTTANLATTVAAAFNTQLTAANTAGTIASAGITLTAATNTVTIAIAANTLPAITAQGAQGGGLAVLSLIDVSTEGGAKAALASIEGLTQTSIDAAAGFGSTAKRVDIQMEFLKGLTDGLNSGIGALVDADMEETSARLQALQVQQQLGIQALSIANQQPQTLLSLFR